MIEVLAQYKIYITIGVLIIPSFLCIVYITKKIIENKRETDKTTTGQTKKRDQIIDDAIKDEIKYIRTMMENIRKDIYTGKSEVYRRSSIEDDIDNFYKQAGSQQNIGGYAHRYQQKNPQEEEILHKEQVRIMNQNINKFLIIYREKEKVIEEKNRHIQILQQRFNEIEREIENIHSYKEKTEYIFEQKLDNLKEQIQEEEKRTMILMILFILVILANIGGFIYMST